jgi:hypothetical protein
LGVSGPRRHGSGFKLQAAGRRFHHRSERSLIPSQQDSHSAQRQNDTLSPCGNRERVGFGPSPTPHPHPKRERISSYHLGLVVSHLEQGRGSLPCSKCEMTRALSPQAQLASTPRSAAPLIHLSPPASLRCLVLVPPFLVIPSPLSAPNARRRGHSRHKHNLQACPCRSPHAASRLPPPCATFSRAITLTTGS